MPQSSGVTPSGSDPLAPSRRRVGTFVAIIGVAFLSWAAWIGEVMLLKGWAGTAWATGFNWSSLPIATLIAVAAGKLVAPRAGPRNQFVFVVGSTLLWIGMFSLAKWAVIDMSSTMAFDWVPALTVPLGAILGALVLASTGVVLMADGLLAPMRSWTSAAMIFALAVTVPLAFGTIRMFPAFNGSVDEIHAIKMGYPVFWAAIAIQVVLLVGRAKHD